MKHNGKFCLSPLRVEISAAAGEFIFHSAMEQIFSISFAALIFWSLFYQEKSTQRSDL